MTYGVCLNQVEGEWKLLYSTISILGSKRTKLGLRDFINLGDFVQIIDVDQVCCSDYSKITDSAPSSSTSSIVANELLPIYGYLLVLNILLRVSLGETEN